jgi:hypothetical protein
MSSGLIDGGIGAILGGAIGWLLQKTFEYKMRARLSQIETDLRTQSQWVAARLTRTDERRARTLSRLHTNLDRALHLTEEYIGSSGGGNPAGRVDELRRSAIVSWVEFNFAFERAEIFLSVDLAEKIRSYGDSIADVRVTYEQGRGRVAPDADLELRLAPLDQALRSLSQLRSDVRPQLINEIRSALGSNALDR